MSKPLTFKALFTGQAFTFASEAEFSSMARGPWVKVGPSSYRAIVDGYAHGPTIRVGTAKAAVVAA